MFRNESEHWIFLYMLLYVPSHDMDLRSCNIAHVYTSDDHLRLIIWETRSTVLFPRPARKEKAKNIFTSTCTKIDILKTKQSFSEHPQPRVTSVCKFDFISCGDQQIEVRGRRVIIEWKADDSPISFETSLFAILYYIKPNQLSQKAACYNNRELGGHFLNRGGRLQKPKHALCDYSDEGTEIL